MSATGNGITIKSSKYEYQAELESMMYTFGEMRHPNIETVQIVESIIRSQMIETLIQASQLARKRGNRFFSHDDLLFLIRRDRLKVAHLTAYLSWRKVRKIASRTGNTAQEEDEMVLDEGEERKVKRQKVKLPWSLANSFTDYLGDASDSDTDDEEREFFNESRERLKHADIATQSMTQEEYMEYAECRQASFTYKKPSKFREWLSIEHYTGMRLNNDLLDILGFICYEMVRSLTEQCLAIKKANEGKRQPTDAAQSSENNSVLQSIASKSALKFKPVNLFSSPNIRTPILPEHVMEAYRRLQFNEATVSRDVSSVSDIIPSRNGALIALRNFTGAPVKSRLALV